MKTLFKKIGTSLIVILFCMSFAFAELDLDDGSLIDPTDTGGGTWSDTYDPFCPSCTTPPAPTQPKDDFSFCDNGDWVLNKSECLYCPTLKMTTAPGNCPAGDPTPSADPAVKDCTPPFSWTTINGTLTCARPLDNGTPAPTYNQGYTWITSGYRSYSSGAPSTPYQMTNWNIPSAPRAPTAPQYYNPSQTFTPQPTQPGSTYNMTNWNTNPIIPASTTLRQFYIPGQTYIVPTSTQGPSYTMTNWNMNSNYTASSAPQYYNSQQTYTKTCADGTKIPLNDTCYRKCPNGVTIPEYQTCPSQTQTCWNGAVIPVTEVCPAQTKRCLDGRSVPILETCTKVCPNGATIPESSVCPVQTKTCLNGIKVGINDQCMKVCQDGKVVSETVSCLFKVSHSVNTTLANNITDTTAVCNGVAFIANNESTLGYFEYGTDLNNMYMKTSPSTLAYGNQVPFSQTLTGLTPGGTYYCRAVISNKDGTYKGEIAKLTTSKTTTVTNMVATPITTVIRNYQTSSGKTTSSTSAVKATTTKNIVCMDISGNATSTNGQNKFVLIELIKDGELYPGKDIFYRISYKNISPLDLDNVYFKISIPKDLEYMNSDGELSGNEVKLRIGQIKAGTIGELTVRFRVKDDAVLGNSVIMSALVYYEMLDEKGNRLSDENSTYSVSSISNPEGVDLNSDSGWNISSLFKWLLFALLILILFILGRSIYNLYLNRKYHDAVVGAHGAKH